MLQIRHDVFETNSSSSHCLVIPRFVGEYQEPKAINFRLGRFKWGEDKQSDYAQQKLTTLQEKADYLWTAISLAINAKAYTDGFYDDDNRPRQRGRYEKELIEAFETDIRKAFPQSKLTFQYLTDEEEEQLSFGYWQSDNQKYLFKPVPYDGFYSFFENEQNLRTFLLDEKAVVEMSDETETTPSEELLEAYESIPRDTFKSQDLEDAKKFLELAKDNLVLPLDNNDDFWPEVQESKP